MKERFFEVKDIDEIHPLYELMNFGNKPRRLYIMAAYPGDFWQISHKLRENDIIKVYFDGIYKRPILFKRDAYLEMARKHNLRLIKSKKPTMTFNPDFNVIMDEFLEQKLNNGILDKVEKEYLSAVIKPFRDNVEYITKFKDRVLNEEFIGITCKGANDFIAFPNFKCGTIYKGMEKNKNYTLEELGL